MSSRFKKIYLLVMIIVPFIIYSGYYYYQMLRKAPFKFSEFEKMRLSYAKDDQLAYAYDSQAERYTYRNEKDSLLTISLKIPVDTLRAIHRKMFENLFFDMPREMDPGKDTYPVYTLEMDYKHKKQRISWDRSYADTRYNDRVQILKRYIESKIKENFREEHK